MSPFPNEFDIVLGAPAHGGSCVGRYDGRVVFVRHGLPGERVRVEVTEDRGGSFCRADVVEVLDASPDRVTPLCPISGPGGAGCCDLSHVTPPAQRAWKAAVVAEQLARIARVEQPVEVAALPGSGVGWRTRVRLAVGADGRAGLHGYRSGSIVTDLRCPQPVPGTYDGLADRRFTAGADLAIAVDDAGTRHIVEIAAAQVSRTGRRSPGRRGATARRAAVSGARSRHVVDGPGSARQTVAGRTWNVDAAGFWQAHRDAPQAYSDCIAEWADVAADGVAWDLYSGVGVFGARLAERAGRVIAVESARGAVEDGRAALADLAGVEFVSGRVERVLADLPDPDCVVLDPPRAGAGGDVVAGIAARRPRRVIHIGCDPAAFARDVALYGRQGYRLERLRAFDAFPSTHHVEVIGELVSDGR